MRRGPFAGSLTASQAQHFHHYKDLGASNCTKMPRYFSVQESELSSKKVIEAGQNVFVYVLLVTRTFGSLEGT